VGFGAEEVGLQGSGHFSDHLPVAAGDIDAMINIDTVGQLADGRLSVSGVGTSGVFAELVAAAGAAGPELVLARGGWSGSDHMVFNTREIPVLFLFGGAYPQYNRPSDTADSLDPHALRLVADFAARLVDAVRTVPGPLPWVMVGEKDLRDEEGGPGNRQTWLGTLPDFTEETAGYQLAGVFDGSPAARAGLEKGDVLVELGGRKITDLATFTRALRAHLPGDPVEIVARRAGRPLRFTVILGDRADRK
jgi:membrane-associated protease RseP (regulator of RpoE activity)